MAALWDAYPLGFLPYDPMALPCFLPNLPQEIMYKICEEVVGPNEDTGSLARLARTCRTLNQVATPLLYRELKFDAQGHFDWETNHTRNLGTTLQALFTLQGNQALGSAVRSMELGPTSSTLWRINWHITFGMFQAYNATIRHLFDLDPTHNGSFPRPATTMALIFSAPNLTSLQLTTESGWQDTNFLLNKHNNRVTGPKFILANLTTLNINHSHLPWNRDAGTVLHKLNGLLHTVPNLTSLTINLARGGTSMTARLPNLTTLVLINTHLCARGLHHLTRACTQLVHFELTHDPESPHKRFLPVSPGQVLDCVVPSRHTLQRLCIKTWMPEDNMANTLTQQQFPLLERLGGFPALRLVGVDYRAVVRRQYEDGALVELLNGLESLQGVVLLGVEASGGLGGEVEMLKRGIGCAVWPRLRAVRVQSLGDGGFSEGIWTSLETLLGRMGWVAAPQRAERMEMVTAGVSFVAVPAWAVE
ncbi:hypothetical protein C8A01DRAFT_39065 [Parachaetomium inaequale]|uniref:F-box domain-containing protein n=1 Tax=Parachaetomium inaequale TaxID=2588326 RepID=A0AAN6P9W5_9PEZI|nr:hypothetical protein C8A01DRAFT_39065 [Parachaetomium inaequale]